MRKDSITFGSSMVEPARFSGVFGRRLFVGALVLLGISTASAKGADSVARPDGNSDSVPAEVVRSDSRAAPIGVVSADLPPAGQRLVFRRNLLGCDTVPNSSVSLLPALSPIVVQGAYGIRVPRGTDFLELEFTGLTRMRPSILNDGIGQIIGFIRIRESAGPGPWVEVARNIGASQTASYHDFSMWSSLSIVGFASVSPGVDYDVEVVGIASTAGAPATYNYLAADVCRGVLVVRQ